MDIDAFILIGGRSSRFGTDKAFAGFRGETLAARAAKTAEIGLSAKSATFIVASEGQFESKLLSGLGHTIISDRKPGFGAWSGIDTALANSSSSEWIFVLACDLPFVSAELVNMLAGFTDEDLGAVVPRQKNGHLQPLCAFYRVESATAIFEQMLARPQPLPPVHTVFDRLTARFVEPDEYDHLANSENLFANINSPDELAVALTNSNALDQKKFGQEANTCYK